ncbi:MAG: hypothetical protein WCV69_04885 [Patescibacteria group bacterium]|jgi:hypothetical protein
MSDRQYFGLLATIAILIFIAGIVYGCNHQKTTPPATAEQTVGHSAIKFEFVPTVVAVKDFDPRLVTIFRKLKLVGTESYRLDEGYVAHCTNGTYTIGHRADGWVWLLVSATTDDGVDHIEHTDALVFISAHDWRRSKYASYRQDLPMPNMRSFEPLLLYDFVVVLNDRLVTIGHPDLPARARRMIDLQL